MSIVWFNENDAIDKHFALYVRYMHVFYMEMETGEPKLYA